MGDIGITHPELITPYIEKFIEKLNEDSQHPAIYRNLLRILMNMEMLSLLQQRKLHINL
jgi:hypothetical protein